MIDPNDPELWKNVDWDEPEVPELLKKTDGKVNVARMNRLRAADPEWRQSVSKANKGKKRSEETRQRMSESSKGKQKSQEHKESIRHAAKNRPPISKETAEKIKLANTGKKRSEETRQKLSQLATARGKRPAEVCKKTSQTKRSKSNAIVTPFGVFYSRADAIEFYNSTNNCKGGRDYIQYRLVKLPEQFYYITKEEYMMLTGKEI